MSGHTPGEWTMQTDPHGTSDDWMIGVVDGKPDAIAVCSKRDAPILRAAPDLLAALESTLRHCILWQGELDEFSCEIHTAVVAKARAAISKARGES